MDELIVPPGSCDFLKVGRSPPNNENEVSVKRSLSPDLKHTHIRRISSFSANAGGV